MKKRFLAILIVLVLSLGLVTVALAAASAAQADVQGTVLSAAQTLQKTAPTRPDFHDDRGGPPVTYLPSGVAWSAPRSPNIMPDWDSYTIRHPRVILEGGQYYMWYNGYNRWNDYPIGLATSPDGAAWTKDVNNPILESGPDGAWDSDYRGQAAYLVEGGIYKMWYSGGNPTAWQTGYATSTNGIDWNIYAGNPVLLAGGSGDWDEGEADGPTIINDGGTYKMWYHGCNADYSACAIGYATSPDGETWTKYASNPVLTGTPGDWDELGTTWPQVIKNGSTYMLWYYGVDATGSGLGLATSSDGINWVKDPNNPVMKTGYDGNPVRGHSVMLDGSTYKMWYSVGAAFTGIGYAESTDGINWTEPVSNPVLLPGSPGLLMSVNYAHDWLWALGTPNTALTITLRDNDGAIFTQIGQMAGDGWYASWDWPWDPNNPDIMSGNIITVENAGLTTTIDPIGAIDGYVDVDADTVAGAIHAPWFDPLTLTVRCEVWVDDPPPGIMITDVAADGGSYFCDFGAEGWDIQPGQQVAVLYYEPDGDQVINVFETPWMHVNYAHDWVEVQSTPDTPITITVRDNGGTIFTQIGQTDGNGWYGSHQWPWDNPKNPDIAPGSIVTATTPYQVITVDPVGAIDGVIDDDANTIAGAIYAPWFDPLTLTVRCEVWVENGPPGIEVTGVPANGGSYFCDFDDVGWDIEPGQQVAVMYGEPDGDWVINIFDLPWMRVNYAHDNAGGNYPAGHTFWITVTNSDDEFIASTYATTEPGAGWGGTDGFETKNPWTPQQPDIQDGDWVYFVSDDGYENTMHVGTINGDVDADTDSVGGNVYAEWFTDTLPIECHPWGAPGPAPQKSSTAGPDGDPPYFCQWDPFTEWDIKPGQDVAVMYIEPDGDRVINVFQEPAPHLWINTWPNGTPGEGGNIELNVQYNNDGQAPALGVVISSTLEGMDYIGDTSGFSHTGTGVLGDPIVWDVGYLPPEYQFNQQFLVFAAVTVPASQTITHTVQIEATPPTSQGDQDSKYNQWSGHVEPASFDLNINTWPWTWDPLPASEYVYAANVCQSWGTSSGEVILTDSLPLSTTLVDWWSQYGDWTFVNSNDNRLVVSRPTISGGCSEVYVRVALDPNAWEGMTLSNTATIAASGDADPDNNTTTVWHNVGSPHYNLSLWPNWHWGSLVPGGDIFYELGYQNNSNLPVDDLRITATLPVSTTFNFSYRFDQYGWHPVTPTLVVPGEYMVWDFGPMDNGYGGTLGVALTIDPGVDLGTVLTYTAQINTPPVEDDFDDNTLTWVDIVNDHGPNLRIEKRFDNWQGDNTLSYELHALNMGTEYLDDIWITDTYPADTSFNGDWNINHGPWVTYTHDAENHTLSFLLDGLNPGETANVGYRINLDEGVVGVPGLIFANSAEAPIPDDVFPADNESQVTVHTGPDLYVEKTLETGEVLPGELLTFDLKFGNAQNPGAGWWGGQGNVLLTDTLPAEMSFVSSELLYCGLENWCDFEPTMNEGNIVFWELWPLGVGGHNEIRLTVMITAPVTSLDTLVNWVEIESDQPENDIEPNYDNNTDSLALTPAAMPALEVSKVYTSSEVAGMPVAYTLTVANSGDAAATNVGLWDWLPDWVDYGGGGSYDAGLITWTLPLIDSGSSATAWFTGTLSCSAGGEVENEFYFVNSSDQGVISDNGAPVSFTIQAPTILAGFDVSTDSPAFGQMVYFTSTSTTDGTPLTFAWDFDDGDTASGPTASHLFTDPGTYQVTLTVTDGCGFSETYSLDITVMPIKIYLPFIVKNYQ